MNEQTLSELQIGVTSGPCRLSKDGGLWMMIS